MALTKIEWTDHVWNPIRGCSRVSRGCEHCYAEAVATRFSGPGQPYEGLVTVKNGDRHGENGRARTGVRGTWNGVVRVIEDHMDDPLKWRKPRRIFVNSMSDLFHEALPDEQILRILNVVRAGHANGHTFQILTKRPARMQALMSRLQFDATDAGRMFLQDRGLNRQGTPISFAPVMSQMWLGVSVENQATADERVPLLRETPAAVRFISYEPALEAVTWPDLSGVHWMILGGESGSHARRCHVDWMRESVRQCRAAGVAPFVKQLGGRAFANCSQCDRTIGRGEYGGFVNACGPTHAALITEMLRIRDGKGGDMAEWPEDLRVREYPA